MSDSNLERILIIDDSSDYRKLIKTFINKLLPSVEIIEYDPVFEGVPDDNFNWSEIDVLLLDYHLSIVGTTGLDILHKNHKKNSFPATIMLTGAGTEEIAIRAINLGIYEYQPKQSLTKDKLKQSIIHAWEDKKTQRKKKQEITQHNRAFSKEVFYENLEQVSVYKETERALVIIKPDDIETLEEEIGIIGRDNLVNHIAKNSFEVFKLGACNPNITRISDTEIGVQIDYPINQETLDFNMQGLSKHLSKCTFKFSEEKYKFSVSIGVLKLGMFNEPAERLIHIASTACKYASKTEGNSHYIWKETDVVPEVKKDAVVLEQITKDKIDTAAAKEKENLELDLKAAAEAKQKAETAIQAEQEAKKELEAKLKIAEEAKAKAEAELKLAAEAKQKAEAEAKMLAQEEARKKAEAELKSQEEARIQAEQKAKEEAEIEANKRAQAEILAAQEAIEKANAEEKAQAELRADQEAKQRLEAELKAEAEAKAKAQAELRAEQEAKQRLEAELKAEAEAKAKAQAELRAEQEAKEKEEAKLKAIAEEKAKVEAEIRAEQEANAKLQAEAEIKSAREEKAKLEAELKAIGEAKEKAEAEMKAAREEKEKLEAQLKAFTEAKSKAETDAKTVESIKEVKQNIDTKEEETEKQSEPLQGDANSNQQKSEQNLDDETKENESPDESLKNIEEQIKKLIDENRITQTYQPIIAMFGDEDEAKEIYKTGLQVTSESNELNEHLSDTSIFSVSLQQTINEWILRQVFLRITESGTTKCQYMFVITVSESWFSDIALFQWLQKILSQTKKYNPGKAIILDVPIDIFIKHQNRAEALISTLRKSHHFTIALSNIHAVDNIIEHCSLISPKLLVMNIEQLKKLSETLAPQNQQANHEDGDDGEESEKLNLLQYLKSKNIRLITSGVEDSTILTDAITAGSDYTIGSFVGDIQDNLVESKAVESFELT